MSSLGNAELNLCRQMRQEFHRYPELSGAESHTSERLQRFLAAHIRPDEMLTGIGGHGVLALFESQHPGPTVVFRADMDAVSVHETSVVPYRSEHEGKAHMCGHDGHMTTLLALGIRLARERPESGRVGLLFQPAEEDGTGAMAVLADERFQALAPDYVIGWHNLPGTALGTLLVRSGSFACASCGMEITFTGKTSHAARPEDGISPQTAMCRLLEQLTALSTPVETDEEFALVTVVYARLGEPAFGIAPGDATIMVTLRTAADHRMQALRQKAEALVIQEAEQAGLQCSIRYRDEFAATENHPVVVSLVMDAAEEAGLNAETVERPMRWSEDFGQFTRHCKGALFCLGSGESCPQLHNPDYDFPDALIELGSNIMLHAARRLLMVSTPN
ncbi:amidohydrolase [Kistimonas scapharcae]|uniref:Amidohydrolase n=1 Tax=Kistimonas scapharcae TaxID=1036133 RepID=A0ABP8V200_9GAMM